MLLFPRSRPVGVKTESTAWEGGVQPGGGRLFAAAQADTGSMRLVWLEEGVWGVVELRT